MAAFNARTGDVLWKTDRMASVGWGTPIVIDAGDRDELIVNGQQKVYAYDPGTGAELWSVSGTTREVIPTPVVGHGLVFARRDGPARRWRSSPAARETSPRRTWRGRRRAARRSCRRALLHGDLLYMINDMQSILTVLDAKTGAAVYQDRLGQATREGFSSSPVAVGDKLFFTNDRGQTFVVQAGRTFNLLHVNELRRHGAGLAGARRRRLVLAHGQGTPRYRQLTPPARADVRSACGWRRSVLTGKGVMTRRLATFALAAILALSAATALRAADISGKWTAVFDTQIGQQSYTYEFVVKDSTLTGKMTSNLGSSDVIDGKVTGDKVSFVEIFKFEGMDVRITYTGTVVSADEIKFTRQVADFATEELVAKRVK